MWFALAIAAAALWGVTYALDERLLRSISVPTMLFFSSVASAAVTLVYAIATQRLAPDLKAIASSRNLALLLVGGVVTYIVANIAISHSIAGKNATVAAFIEVAYPLFTALAVWLFFKEQQLTAATLVGGLLIFSGAVVISLSA